MIENLKCIVKKDEFAFLPKFIFFLNNRPAKKFIEKFGKIQIFLLSSMVFYLSSMICSTDFVSNLIPEFSKILPISITGIFTIILIIVYEIKTMYSINEDIDKELLKRCLDLYSLILSNQDDLKEKFIDNDCEQFDKLVTDISILLYTEMIPMENLELEEDFIEFLKDLNKGDSENTVSGLIKLPFETLRDFIRYCVMIDIMQMVRYNVSVENIARDIKGITINQYSEVLYDRNLAFNYIINSVDKEKVKSGNLFYIPRNFRDALTKRLEKEYKQKNKNHINRAKKYKYWWNVKDRKK